MPDDQVVRDALVQIQETGQTNIEINRYAPGDPESPDIEETTVEVPEGEIEDVRQEIEEQADEIEEADDLAEVTGVDVDVSDMEPVVEEQEAEPAQTVSEGPSVEGSQHLQAAREVVDEADIGPTDFVVFRSRMLDRDVSDDRISELWATLRDEGVINGDGDEGPPSQPEMEAPPDPETRPEEEGPEPETVPDSPPADGRGEAEMIEMDGGFAARLPEWAMEPWDVVIDPMGAGGLFEADAPCSSGQRSEVVYHFAIPDEAETLLENDEVTAQHTSDGGMFDTEWARSAASTVYNGLAGEDGAGEGVLVGLHVCMEEGVPVGTEWEEVSQNRWKREGGYLVDETVAWRIEKEPAVPDNAPIIDELIAPEEQIPEPRGRADGGWQDGQGILLTQDGCPSCREFKDRDDVQDALASGALVEVTPSHPDWNTIVSEAGVDVTPSVVRREHGTFRPVAGDSPGNA